MSLMSVHDLINSKAKLKCVIIALRKAQLTFRAIAFRQSENAQCFSFVLFLWWWLNISAELINHIFGPWGFIFFLVLPSSHMIYYTGQPIEKYGVSLLKIISSRATLNGDPPSRLNMSFCQEHPKWDQNPKYLSPNKTTSISSSPPPPFPSPFLSLSLPFPLLSFPSPGIHEQQENKEMLGKSFFF